MRKESEFRFSNLTWRTNFGNPYTHDYRDAMPVDGETYMKALQRDRAFFDSMIKGRPKATDDFTVEQLEAMGMVGLYTVEQEKETES